MINSSNMPPIDLRLPLSDLEQIAQQNMLVMVFPDIVPLAHLFGVESMVRILGIEDAAFFAGIRGLDVPDAALQPQMTHFLDIHYVRKCRVRHVLDSEWGRCYYYNSAKHMVERYDDDAVSFDTPCTVVCFKSPDYDLRKLQRQYPEYL